MIPRYLKLLWYPIVGGVWFAVWVFLTPLIKSDSAFWGAALVCAVVGALWSAWVIVLRIKNHRNNLSDRQAVLSTGDQMMFDTATYPLLVLVILSLLNCFW